ncbi:MAG: outer membrane beta-barrel protein [Bacteroidales bacterium]|nr:outer membrane beta-barrel protein [Bacteroidales bacterium]
MMKRIIAIALVCILALQTVQSQTIDTLNAGNVNAQKEQKPMVFRDRLIMDIYHTFWMNMPTEVTHLKFDPGFTISAIWDFKIKEKPIAIGLGVGVSYYTQYSNALLQYDQEDDIMRYYVLSENVKYKLLKMNYLNVNIPLEFRYRNSNGFKFSVGARVGLICEVSQKYKGQDPLTVSDTAMYKNLHIENKMKYNVDVYARIGWKFINAYYSFQPTPLFTVGKGPKICPMSVGISLSIF